MVCLKACEGRKENHNNSKVTVDLTAWIKEENTKDQNHKMKKGI